MYFFKLEINSLLLFNNCKQHAKMPGIYVLRTRETTVVMEKPVVSETAIRSNIQTVQEMCFSTLQPGALLRAHRQDCSELNFNFKFP